MDDDIQALSTELNRVADQHPSARWLQDLRDALTDEAFEMLRTVIEETLP
jgi:hypothetical protein